MREKWLRATLYFTFAYNLMGFVTFLLPGQFGQLAGLPEPEAFLYNGFIALNILTFAFVGLWQARQQTFNVPVLVIFGVSKITFCGLMLASWLAGAITFAGFAMSLVDLVMGVIFLLGAKAVADGTLR